MGKKSAPKVSTPDPTATANAQTASNKETALWNAVLNNVNQVTPYGNMNYTQTPGAEGQPPTFTATQTLDPSSQRQLDLSNSASEKALQAGNNLFANINTATQDPFTINGNVALPSDFSADRQRIEGELYNRSMARLEPQFQDDTNALENKLINQGLTRGSEAFDKALQKLGYQQNDARNSAMQSAISQANQAQQNEFNMALQGRQQGIQEDVLKRSQPINEVSQLLGLGGNIQAPQFVNPTNVSAQSGDLQSGVWNAYNAQMQQAQAQAAQRQSTMNSIFGLAGTAAFLASDRRVKDNITRVGEYKNLPVYTFTYKSDPYKQEHIGFMADEVKEVFPDAVKSFFGVDHVNYAEVMNG